MNLIIFITHNFTKEFVNTLTKLNDSIVLNDYKIIVLFDADFCDNNTIVYDLKNIEIIKTTKINSSYDNYKKGHTLYIHFFKKNRKEIKKYDYIWIIENDVYYPNSFVEFIDAHKCYSHDLLVPEYGVRSPMWPWAHLLKGFKKVHNIGVLAVIMRFSQKFLLKLIDEIDINYFGFFEAILPHICIENKLSIQQFLPEMCGVLQVFDSPLIKLIEQDIQNNTRKYVEKKIYHPIKL